MRSTASPCPIGSIWWVLPRLSRVSFTFAIFCSPSLENGSLSVESRGRPATYVPGLFSETKRSTTRLLPSPFSICPDGCRHRDVVPATAFSKQKTSSKVHKTIRLKPRSKFEVCQHHSLFIGLQHLAGQQGYQDMLGSISVPHYTSPTALPYSSPATVAAQDMDIFNLGCTCHILISYLVDEGPIITLEPQPGQAFLALLYVAL
nr:hypothetical protein K21LAMBDA1_LOCUS61 [Klebsiella phage vB_Kpn_K21lambda1]